MSTVWDDKDGCTKQYTFAFAIYLMTVLSYSHVIIMVRALNTRGHGNNFDDGLNATEKFYLKGKWNLLLDYQVTTH